MHDTGSAMRSVRQLSVTIMMILTVAVLAGEARAVSLINPSFEDMTPYSAFPDGTLDGGDQRSTPAGWNARGNWDQDGSEPENLGRGGAMEDNYLHLPANAPAGGYVGYMVLRNDLGNPSNQDLPTNTLWQRIATTLQPNTTYTLRVKVANRTTDGIFDLDENPDVTVRAFFTLGDSDQDLLASAVGTMYQSVASDLTAGQWNLATATLDTTGLGDLNQDLNIVLHATSTNAGVTVIRWDDVQVILDPPVVANPSFEDTDNYDTFPDGTLDGGDERGLPPGWRARGNWDVDGPEPEALGRGGILEDNYLHLPSNTPDGDYAAFMALRDESSAGNNDLAINTLWQTLTLDLDADMLYVLDVDVANRTTDAAYDLDELPDITVRAFFTLGDSDQDEFSNKVGDAYEVVADAMAGGVWNAAQARFSTRGLANLSQSLNIVLGAQTVTTTQPGVSVIRWDNVRVTRHELAPTDYDGDGDVDPADLATFQGCYSGPAIPLTGGCEDQDHDSDNDVDGQDFGIFQRCLAGEDTLVGPDCVN